MSSFTLFSRDISSWIHRCSDFLLACSEVGIKSLLRREESYCRFSLKGQVPGMGEIPTILYRDWKKPFFKTVNKSRDAGFRAIESLGSLWRSWNSKF